MFLGSLKDLPMSLKLNSVFPLQTMKLLFTPTYKFSFISMASATRNCQNIECELPSRRLMCLWLHVKVNHFFLGILIIFQFSGFGQDLYYKYSPSFDRSIGGGQLKAILEHNRRLRELIKILPKIDRKPPNWRE